MQAAWQAMQSSSDAHIETNVDFSFQILGINTTRQLGKTMDCYVNWRYREDSSHCPFSPHDNECIQYQKDVHSMILNRSTMPSPELELGVEWERVALNICRGIWADWKHIIQAVSVAVHVNGDGRSEAELHGMPYEPGAHGATCTIGPMPPIALPNRLYNLGGI